MFRKALVVGATGYIATEIVKQLLEKGYHVVGTTRDVSSPASKFLEDLAAAFPGTLQLVEADIMTEGSIDIYLEELDYVFHLASPIFLQSKNPQKEIDVAVQGTENVLNSVAEHGRRVRKVILASALSAAIDINFGPKPEERTVTHEDWNKVSSIENGQAYFYSKVLQERRAWQLAEAKGINLVTILPSGTTGPYMSPHTGPSGAMYMRGLALPTCKGFNVVDTRDAAKAHILAAEASNSSGRYLVSLPDYASMMLGVDEARACFPNIFKPANCSDGCFTVDGTKAQSDLGFTPGYANCFYTDSIRTWWRLGLLKIPPS